MITVQRISKVQTFVDAIGNQNFLWGAAEDGVLNGGTTVTASITNPGADDLTVTIQVQAARLGVWVSYATTVTCPTGSKSIVLTQVSGYAMRFKGNTVAGAGAYMTTSVEVQA